MKSNENIYIYHTNWKVGTSEISKFSIQQSIKVMPTIQTYFLTIQMTENIKKWSKMVSEGGTQNPSKIIQNPSWDLPGFLWVHLCPTWSPKWCQNNPKDLQSEPKWWSKDPKKYILNSVPLISILKEILLILSLCKSAVNWLPEGPAAGEKP